MGNLHASWRNGVDTSRRADWLVEEIILHIDGGRLLLEGVLRGDSRDGRVTEGRCRGNKTGTRGLCDTVDRGAEKFRWSNTLQVLN